MGGGIVAVTTRASSARSGHERNLKISTLDQDGDGGGQIQWIDPIDQSIEQRDRQQRSKRVKAKNAESGLFPIWCC